MFFLIDVLDFFLIKFILNIFMTTTLSRNIAILVLKWDLNPLQDVKIEVTSSQVIVTVSHKTGGWNPAAVSWIPSSPSLRLHKV